MCRAAAHELCDERRAEVEAAGGRIVAVLTDGVEEPAAALPNDRPYRHPYYWSSFVLIGASVLD